MDISPELYKIVVGSASFEKDFLMRRNLSINDRKISFEEYYNEEYKQSGLELIKSYTIGLRSKIQRNSEESKNSMYPDAFSRLAITDFEVHERLRNSASVNYDKKNGSVRIDFDFPDALGSTLLANDYFTLLESYIIKFKIEKANNQLSFVKERYEEKEKEFSKIQENLAEFNDANIGLSSEVSRLALRKLESQYEIVLTVFKELARQLEQAELKVLEDTPVFTVIKPASIPVKRIRPQRIKTLLIFFAFGFMLGCGFTLVVPQVRSFFN